MSEERRKILEMLSKGKIDVDAAERLLTAVNEPASSASTEFHSSGKAAPKYLRILVEPAPGNSDGERVNVRVPMNLIRAGMKWVALIPRDAQGKVQEALSEKGMDMDFSKLKPEDLEELITNLGDLEVEVNGKEKVRIFCE
ncbi:hypothetical protein KAR48_14995 [bacterium]|nr:hypothetical protein [bacterium]